MLEPLGEVSSSDVQDAQTSYIRISQLDQGIGSFQNHSVNSSVWRGLGTTGSVVPVVSGFGMVTAHSMSCGGVMDRRKPETLSPGNR